MKYHYACLNITSAYFTKNIHELSTSWHCPSCENVTRRIRNDNTPVRKQLQETLNDSTMSVDDLVINSVDKNKHYAVQQQKESISKIQTSPDNNDIMLEKISLLLDKKLEENKKYIFGEIRNTIQCEIQQTSDKYFQEFSIKTDLLMNEQSNIKQKVNSLNNIIEKIEKENNSLQEEIRHMQSRLNNSNLPENQKSSTENSKKIVLFGLTEYDNETEHHLQHRIINIFLDILNIDLTGYNEETIRIGRKPSRRPIVIELLSKKMSKYILQNGRLFKNTGLSISEYLDENARKIRQDLLGHLHTARRNGHHAYIKNNNLYVNGKITFTHHQSKAETKTKTSLPSHSLQQESSPSCSYVSVNESISNNATHITHNQTSPNHRNFRA